MFDIQQFLNQHSRIVEGPTAKGEMFLDRCPYCGAPKTHKSSFTVSKVRPVFYCYRCGTKGNWTKLVSKLGKMSYQAAGLIVGHVKANKTEEKKEEQIVVRFPTSAMWSTRAVNYLEKRQIDAKTRDHFHLYFCNSGKYRDRIIVPVFHKGERITFQGRTVLPDGDPRYLSPPNDGKNRLLFNYDSLSTKIKVVILAEGPFDVIRLYQNRVTAVCSLGKSISDTQIALLKERGIKKVILMQDRDALVRIDKGIGKLWRKLSSQFDVEIAPVMCKNDPGELDRAETQEILQSTCCSAYELKRMKFETKRRQYANGRKAADIS